MVYILANYTLEKPLKSSSQLYMGVFSGTTILKHCTYGVIWQLETNRVFERFNRTLKEPVVKGRVFRVIEKLREAVRDLTKLYATQWLMERIRRRSV